MVSPNGNGSNGHVTYPYIECASDYEPRPEVIDVVAREPQPGWHDQNPNFVHSLTWTDADGVGHMLVLRSDDLQSLFADIKMVKGLIKRSKEKATTANPEASQAQEEPDTQRCAIHDVDMPRRWSKRTSGHYFGHKCSDGSFCYGKAKNGKA